MKRPTKKKEQPKETIQDALLEIGTEEIPASFLPPALAFMKSFAENFLNSKRLAYKNISVMGTPRRMAVLISGLHHKSLDQQDEVWGPSVQAAKDKDGNWTQAAKGFAQAHKTAPENLAVRTNPNKNGEYVCIVKKQEGVKAEKILPELFSQMTASIPFPKKMVWNETGFKFARPLRNLLALHGSKVVPLSIAGVKSGNKTLGLTHVPVKMITVASAQTYASNLKNHCILTDPEARKKTILDSSSAHAVRLKGKLKEDEDLLEEVVWLVEHPVAVLGNFDPSFLELPHEVLSTCMRKHLRYFSLLDAHGKLLPHFIAIRNGISEHQDIVRKGYERVLTARLTDAKFFLAEDMKKPMDFFIQKTGNINLQGKLGSMKDKFERMRHIAKFLIQSTGADVDASAVDRAVVLSKFDLTTSMVFEFPELQGVTGEFYAEKHGENPKVSKAIREHYYPLSNQGELPSAPESGIVAVADKIEGLIGNFLLGHTPSGSADPYGMRRQATGMVRILVQNRWDCSLKELVGESMKQFGNADAKTEEAVLAFLRERFQLLMQDSGFKNDEAVSVTGNAQDPDSRDLKLLTLKEKIAAIHEIRAHPDFEALAAAFKRAGNILKQAGAKGLPHSAESFSETLLKEEAEKGLYDVFKKVGERARPLVEQKQYLLSLKELVTLRAACDQFFDKVLVMDPDASVCQNRLSLLSLLHSLFKQIADFSALQNPRA